MRSLATTTRRQKKHKKNDNSDEEDLNAWKKTAQNGFEPAVKAGKSVKVKYDVPVQFGVL
ncbi:MAG: hypothetical protein DYG98_06775 [Haliscomenobacteraceae bacterium CHB4]|nr:hypothetical protein [Haliscomenobacteraceae bacterium CHB4]